MGDKGLVIESAIAVLVCLVCAALASGLTQGLLTIDLMDLMIKQKSGTELEKKQATILLPLLDRHHLLICTLMLWNATSMEILPLYLSNLVPEWVALILSVTLLLLVGEILPSAILTGPNQIQIAAMLAPMVYLVLILFSPIAYPISVMLDVLVGKDEPITTYNKLELEQLVKIQHEEITKRLSEAGPHGHPNYGSSNDDAVNHEEVNMIAGVLNFANVQVKDKMSREVFSLNVNDKFDLQTLNKIFRSGYSRIPVYDTNPNNVIGLILTKELLFVDLQDEVPIRTFMSLFPRSIAGVKETDTLSEVLKMFQETRTHLAVVFKDDEDAAETEDIVLGIITLEDIVECIIGEDIRDETDIDDERLLRHEERDMEVIRLRLLHPAQHSHTLNDRAHLKLSPQEIQVVAAHLKSNVSEVVELVGEDPGALQAYVSECSVIEIDEAYLEAHPSAPGASATSSSSSSSSTAASSSSQSKAGAQKTLFFKRGEPANTCILILSGKVEILAGREGFKLELGAWAVLGQQVLTSPENGYIPDFSMTLKSKTLRVVCLTKPSSPQSHSNKKLLRRTSANTSAAYL